MPRLVVDRLNTEIRKVLADADTKKRFADLGGEARGGSPEEMRAYIEGEIARWKRVIELRRIERQ
jgi:tripartite-type tricarboxylate transporter receptor subunit TctC